MRVLTAEAMRDVDRLAIEEIGIASLVLMENAALGVAEVLESEFPGAARVAILCGPGNNGGDGLALARHLAVRGIDIEIGLVVASARLQGDAARQLATCRAMGLRLREWVEDRSVAGLAAWLSDRDVVVDAMLGTGLSRPLEGRLARIAGLLNESSVPVLAVDVPSGLSGSRADVPGPAVRATATAALGALKLPHVLPPAEENVGAVVLVDLGIPDALISRAAGDLHLLTSEELAPLLEERPRDTHKGDYGHVLVVGGSRGKAGAMVLAARAAVRVGAGLVTAAVPESVAAVVDGASIESMTLALPEEGEGMSLEAVPILATASGDKSAVGVGPGAGRDPSVGEAIRAFVVGLEVPAVLDADALTAYAGRLEELAKRRADTVLTPHAGELARLLGTDTRAVLADRLAAVREACRRSDAVVVLKGHRSLVADPMGGVYVNPTGNPGMASGGTGDVLTGMVVGLLGQGLDSISAACLAVYLHGAAGDKCAALTGERALTAGDLLRQVPAACLELAAG